MKIQNGSQYIIGCNHNGLANRLLCFYTCLYMAKILYREPRYLWVVKDDEFGCGVNYTDIFNEQWYHIFINTEDILTGHLACEYTAIKIDNDAHSFVEIDKFDVIFSSAMYLYNSMSDKYITSQLTDFHPYIQNEVQNVNIDDNTIGVHIRGGDLKFGYNGQMQQYILNISTIQQYIDQNYTNSKIFVMSEDKELYDEMQKIYGDRIITYSNRHWEVSTRSKLGVIDCLIEMCILGKCNIIIGNQPSTIPLFASTLYNKPVIRL